MKALRRRSPPPPAFHVAVRRCGLPGPQWRAGCSGNLPVIPGVERLIILVDHDLNGAGQMAAMRCTERWTRAGRSVVRLTPKRPGFDFNDLVMEGGLVSAADFEDAITEEVCEPTGTRAASRLTISSRSHRRIHTYLPLVGSFGSVPASIRRVPPVRVTGANGEPVIIKATTWLDQNRAVSQMTWAPGLPMLIKDRMVVDGGWIERPEITCFNMYRPPRLELGDAAAASPWLEHLHTIYDPEAAAHIVRWLAHRVQRPHEKINHGLVLGGGQGIGKDTLLEAVKQAVGPWNFHEISPGHLLGQFNSYAKSVILRVNEARDLGHIDRFTFYDHTKIYTAAPPDVLRVNEKNLREYYVFNCVGFILTTNHKTDGIYLPADDRRHFVAWSPRTKEEFSRTYWSKLWDWYSHGGFGHIAAYLAELDLGRFRCEGATATDTRLLGHCIGE